MTVSQLVKEPLHALVIEDAVQMAERIVELITVPNRLVVVATCATEDDADIAMERNRIDFAIVDLQLAQGTGFGPIRHLRMRPGPTPCVIVVLTNHAVPALKVAAFEAGCDYFLDKSRDLATLPRLVGEFLATAEAA